MNTFIFIQQILNLCLILSKCFPRANTQSVMRTSLDLGLSFHGPHSMQNLQPSGTIKEFRESFIRIHQFWHSSAQNVHTSIHLGVRVSVDCPAPSPHFGDMVNWQPLSLFLAADLHLSLITRGCRNLTSILKRKTLICHVLFLELWCSRRIRI